MAESTKDSGKIIKCMEKANINGLMEDNIKGNILWTKKRDLEFIDGMTEEYTKGLGKMEDSMDKANIFYPIKQQKLEFGKMGKEYGT